tara:strand:+ start:536 stop:751 length:216 start_codon:yes stop_codon:yes gene_type:complete
MFEGKKIIDKIEEKNKRLHDYKILRSAQRIVEDLKISTLFGDSKENFLYATLSEGLAILVRQMNQERRNEQ